MRKGGPCRTMVASAQGGVPYVQRWRGGGGGFALGPSFRGCARGPGGAGPGRVRVFALGGVLRGRGCGGPVRGAGPSVNNSFPAACRRAGIENFRPHDMRHTCAAWLVQAGVSIREVAELLRHSDIRVTMRYAHLAPDNVRAAVSALDGEVSRSRFTLRCTEGRETV
jgi:hypothetical protein